MISNKLLLMQGETLLATLEYKEPADMFWLSYTFQAEDAFGEIRPYYDHASALLGNNDNESDEFDSIYNELFYRGVHLLDTSSNKKIRQFILHIENDEIRIRILDLTGEYVLKKGEQVLAKLLACEDDDKRMGWQVCDFKPTEAFAVYRELFLRASTLIEDSGNPEQVREIYDGMKAQKIHLFKLWDLSDTQEVIPEYRLQFIDDKVYIRIGNY